VGGILITDFETDPEVVRDRDRFAVQIFHRHLFKMDGHIGDDRRDRHPGDRRQIKTLCRGDGLHENPGFILRALLAARETPVCDQYLPLVDSGCDLGITDVDDQQHFISP